MAVRSKQLALVRFDQVVAGAGNTIYTVPSGETTLVKSIYVWNNSAAAAVIDIAVRTSAGVNFPFDRSSVAAGAVLKLDPIWVVMQAGQLLRVSPTIVGQFRFVVSGSELEGVAD